MKICTVDSVDRGMLQLVEQLIALRVRRRGDLAFHDLVDGGFVERRGRDIRSHHAAPEIAHQEGAGLLDGVGIEIGGKSIQSGSFENVDAKAALGGGGDRAQLLVGELRRTVRRKHLAYMRRHRCQ